MIIWIDITNTPHVHFFTPIIEHLKKYYHIIITARQFSETIPLLYEKGYNPIIIGEHQGISRIRKVKGMMSRVKALNIAVPVFDVSMSIGGQVTTILSRLRKKPSIVFTDNDISYKKHVYILGSYFVFPEYFDKPCTISGYFHVKVFLSKRPKASPEEKAWLSHHTQVIPLALAAAI